MAKAVSKHHDMVERLTPYALVGPAIMMITAILLYPILYGVWLSLQFTSPFSGGTSFVGIRNYLEVFSDRNFLNSLKNSIILVTGTMALGIVFATAFALVLVNIPLGRLWRTIILAPYLISGVAGAAMWRYLFAPNTTPFDRFLSMFGIDAPLWLGDPTWTMVVVILANTWFVSPFATLIIYSGLNTVDTSLYEAASLDGAGRKEQFFYITIPTILPHFALAMVFISFASFNTFELILVLTGGGTGSRHRSACAVLLSDRVPRIEFQLRRRVHGGAAGDQPGAQRRLPSDSAQGHVTYVQGRDRRNQGKRWQLWAIA